MATEKIPQTIVDLISSIGESMILFKLYEMAHEKDHLEIFKNYSEAGYDIGIKNSITQNKAKVEVKTRQKLISTGKDSASAQFDFTVNERNAADFLVGYWLEHNDMFIVPVTELSPVKKRKADIEPTVFRFIAKRIRNNTEYNSQTKIWHDKWGLILEFINKKTSMKNKKARRTQ